MIGLLVCVSSGRNAREVRLGKSGFMLHHESASAV